MNRPAVIFLSGREPDLLVAGLSVLDRLLVTVHRAGCSPITLVGPDSLPLLKRSRSLGIEPQQSLEAPDLAELTLVATSNVLVTHEDVEALLARGGRLTKPCGEPLPIGVVSRLSETASAPPLEGPEVVAGNVARVISDPEAAREAERALWESFRSPADGVVDRFFNRPLARLFSRHLVRTGVTPNQITFISVLVGLLAALLLTQGNHSGFIVGAALFQLAAIIDCADGDVARALLKESRLGKWFDLLGDQVVHVALFAGLAVGVARSGSSAPVVALGTSAVLGAIFSAVVLLAWVPRLVSEEDGTKTTAWIHRLANRDFSVLLLALALLDEVEIFLWAVGTCVHLFWIGVLMAGYAHRGGKQLREKAVWRRSTSRFNPGAKKERMT